MAASFYVFFNSVQVFLFSASLPTFIICVLLDDSHSELCEVISPCGFLFLIWLLWLGHAILCWIKVVKVGILVLYLILEEMLSAFPHCVWCWLCFCHIWPLLCWDMPAFWSFTINGWKFLSKNILHLLRRIWFLFFNLLMCHLDWFADI